MKVILLEDVKNIGKKYEIKDVSPGYAKNFLFPKKLAELANHMALKKLSQIKSSKEKESKELESHLTQISELIQQRSLIFEMKTDKNGKTFGSVTKDMILKALRSNKFITKERVEIKLDHPLKEIGEHLIEVNLKNRTKVNLKVILHSQP